MYPRGRFVVKPSALKPGCFFVTGVPEPEKVEPKEEMSFGYIILLKEHADVLAYALNKGHEAEQAIEALRSSLLGVLNR